MAGKTHPSDWRNAAPSTQRLALLALLGVAGGVFLVQHFSAAAAAVVGPTLIARNEAGETLLANGNTVFLVDAGETRTSRVRVEDLGLRGPVLSVSSDGGHWYLGDDATGMLYRCDLGTRHCAAALTTRDGARAFRRAHAVAFAAGRIFITDSEAHRVEIFENDGRAAGSTRTQPLPLCFPNGIVAVGDDLYVADTNNFRIARLPVAAPSQGTTLLHTNVGAPVAQANCNTRSAALAQRGSPFLNTVIDSANTVKRDARPPARHDRVWPANLLHASTGEWWLVQMANQMRDGDVIRYDAEGRPRGRIELPAGADPIELIESRGRVLVTDAGLSRVHLVTLEGRVSGTWGPPDLDTLLADIHAEREFQRGLQQLSFAAIAAGVLAALLVVIVELRRQRTEGWSSFGKMQPVALQPPPLGHQTVWLAPDGDVLGRVQRALWVLVAYTVILLAILLYLARDLRLDTPLGRFRAFVTGIVLLAVILIGGLGAMNVSRLARRRIGVTRDAVWYDPGSGDVTKSPWQDVRASSHALLVGPQLVQVIDKRSRYLYPQAEVESQLLSRLPPTAFVSDGRLLLESMRRGNVALWITAAALALYVGFLLLKWSQPELVQRVGVQFVELFR